MVSPKDFVGAGGPVAGSGTTPGVTVSGGSTPGATVSGGSTPGATVPGGSTPGATSPGGTNPGTNQGTNPGTSSGGGGVQGATAGSCSGFKNGPNVTDKEITIASIADRSGAVADVFKSVHDAMNAYVAYFNSTSTICGRKLKLLTYDSGLSATGSNQASQSACPSAFALVGSLSAFDSGGADVTKACGQPDIRASATEQARQTSPMTIQVMPLNTAHFGLQPWAWVKQKFGTSVIQHSAFVYLNAGASEVITSAIRAQTAAKLGYVWQKTIVIDIAGVPNWNAYANQLKSAGIKFVSANLADFTPRLAAAFKQAGYSPVFLADESAYGQRYISGSDAQAMQGAYSYTQTAMIEEASRVPEMALYSTWLSRTGGDPPSYAGAEAWAAGLLFTTVATELGGRLNRSTLLAALHNVHTFNGNGIITPTDPGSGTSGKCASIMQVQNGRFVRVSPFPYTCSALG